jgi:hypothetical protein
MTMPLPSARGPVTAALFPALVAREVPASFFAGIEDACPAGPDLLGDDDAQLALWVLNALHVVAVEGVPDDREWDPAVQAVHRALEDRFLDALRDLSADTVGEALADEGDVADRLFALTDRVDGPAVAAHLQRHADASAFQEFLAHRSSYNLRESDPQALALPLLDGPAKVAMAELLFDEFGAGRPERLHSTLFAAAMAAADLDPSYGGLVHRLPGTTLAVPNAMYLLHRRRSLLPAAVGHFGAFEATSSEPSRRLAAAARRLGFDEAVATYFDEHVEADAVHEQLMFRGVCAPLAVDAAATEQLFFGSATCLLLEARAGEVLLEAWQDGRSSLLPLADDERLAS